MSRTKDNRKLLLEILQIAPNHLSKSWATRALLLLKWFGAICTMKTCRIDYLIYLTFKAGCSLKKINPVQINSMTLDLEHEMEYTEVLNV